MPVTIMLGGGPKNPHLDGMLSLNLAVARLFVHESLRSNRDKVEGSILVQPVKVSVK